jgi:hypothetical protein
MTLNFFVSKGLCVARVALHDDALAQNTTSNKDENGFTI